MKVCLIFLTFCFVAFFLPLQVSCQAAGTNPLPGIWTIEQCFDYAKQHNIQVNMLQLNKQNAEQDLIAAKGVKTPALSALVGNTFNNANNIAKGNGNLINQLTNSGNYSVNSSIVLWNDHYINNNIRQQGLIVQSAGLSVQQTQNIITLSVTRAFLNILLAKENEKYIVDLVSTSDSSAKQGQLLYEAGSIARVNLLQLQAQAAGNKYLLVQAQNAVKQNILLLKQMLQLPTNVAFDIISPSLVQTKASMPVPLEAEQTALKNFPEIKIGQLGVDIAALGIAKTKSTFKPTLLANGGIGSGYAYTLINNVAPKAGYFTQTGDNFYQNLGVTLAIPIFSQRVNKSNLEKSKIAYKQAALNFENSQLVLTQAVEQAYLSAVNAQQASDAANEELRYATESYRIGNEQLKLGAINTYDLLVLQNQYIQAVQAYTQAKYSAVLQQKIYEFYIGNPITL